MFLQYNDDIDQTIWIFKTLIVWYVLLILKTAQKYGKTNILFLLLKTSIKLQE